MTKNRQMMMKKKGMKRGYKMRPTTEQLAKNFWRALNNASADPCYSLNIGIHEKRILNAWKKLKKNVEGAK